MPFNLPGGPGVPPELNLNPADLEDVECVCGGRFFEQVFHAKRSSPLQNARGMYLDHLFTALRCTACGGVNKIKPPKNLEQPAGITLVK